MAITQKCTRNFKVRIAYVYITDFSDTSFGTHSYARCTFPDGDDRDAERTLSRYDAELLNKHDRNIGGVKYKPGERTTRFENPQQAEKASVEYIRSIDNDIDLILLGSGTTLGPKKILYAHARDKSLGLKLGKLYDRSEQLYNDHGDDPWSAGCGDEMDALIDQWEELIKELPAIQPSK